MGCSEEPRSAPVSQSPSPSVTPEITQVLDMLWRVDLLRRDEVMDPVEPVNVKVRQQPRKDGRLDLYVLVRLVAVTEEHGEAALQETRTVEPIASERGHHRGDAGRPLAHPRRRRAAGR